MNIDKRIGQRLADQSAVGGEGIDTRSAEPSQRANDASASTASQSGKLLGVRSAQAPTLWPREFVNIHNLAPTQA